MKCETGASLKSKILPKFCSTNDNKEEKLLLKRCAVLLPETERQGTKEEAGFNFQVQEDQKSLRIPEKKAKN